MECGEKHYSFVGASKGIRGYSKLRTGPDTEIKPGVIPFPHFPLYSATFAEDIMEQDKYYLNESGSCVMVVAELERSYQATKDTPDTKDEVVINPCDPTGTPWWDHSYQALKEEVSNKLSTSCLHTTHSTV